MRMELKGSKLFSAPPRMVMYIYVGLGRYFRLCPRQIPFSVHWWKAPFFCKARITFLSSSIDMGYGGGKQGVCDDGGA